MRMSGITSKGACLFLSGFLLAATARPVFAQRRKERLDLNQVLSHMDQTAKRLKTLSADLEYTKVTVLVNDFSTESGEMYFRNSKTPDILIKFTAPAPKVILFRKNKAEIYQPKINQVQEFDLSKHAQLIQQFLLLGFGTQSSDMQKVYAVKYLREEGLHGDTTALLELTPGREAWRRSFPRSNFGSARNPGFRCSRSFLRQAAITPWPDIAPSR